MRTPLSDEFGIDLALFAFSYMPDVVVEVCKAGGMGVLGAVRFTPDELSEALDYIEGRIGGRPYGVDIVMPAKTEAVAGMAISEMHDMLEKMIPQEHRDFVESVLDQYGVPKLPADAQQGRDLLSWTDTEARQQVERALSRPDVKILVNALGPPPKDVVDQAHEAGVKVAALIGRKDHALKQLANGVDIIVAQGTEAGGHSGEIATMVLVPEVVDAVGDHPVLAAGGIGSGRQVAAALALGAQGVWTGSMWLNTVECGQPDLMYQKFHEASSSDAVRSRAYTGKPARQLRTAWTDAWDNPDNPAPLGMPLQYMLNAEAQDRIRRSGNVELAGTPIGQLVGSFEEVRTVAEVIATMKHEYERTVSALPRLSQVLRTPGEPDMTAPVDKTDGRPRCPVGIDLIDPDTFADGLPLEKFAVMREEAPVFWHDQPGSWGDGFWVVTRHADVQEVSRTAEVFSSAERGALLHTGAEQDEEVALEMTRLLMINMDPPEHSQYRNIVQRAFTPRTIRNLEPRLVEFANEIVDRALAKGEGDFVKDVAAELPLLAICELIGVPAEDRVTIFDLSNRLIGFDDPEFRTSPDDAMIASTEMYMYADGIAAARRECPAKDIATKLLEASVDGEALSQEQFDVFFLLLMVAGNETTRNAISHGMQAFFDHPDQWELFKKERPLDTAVEEIIRWATPVMQFQRTAVTDYELGGQTIKKGDRVAIYYAAANRDDTALEVPDSFDVTRENNDHVAFGGGGPHFCLGANLARAEIRIMFDVIADRMPDIKPVGTPRTLRSMFINGIKEIPVRYQ